MAVPWPRLLRRCALVAALGASGAAALLIVFFFLALLPLYALPSPRDSIFWLGAVAAPALVAAAGRSRLAAVVPRGALTHFDRLSRRILNGPLAAVLTAGSLGLLLCWAPQYLTWPFQADAEQFALSALSWNHGIVPYRDLADFDFPGPIYEFYLLGKVLGWGRTAPFYAFDLGFLGLLGLALAGWSRRCFGSRLPGLAAYLPFLCHYLGFDYTQVAQRDWHGPFFAVMALLAVPSLRGHAGRLVSALAMAAALSYRPQVLVFLPAVITALGDRSSPSEGSIPVPMLRRDRRVWEWCLAFAVALGLVFLPLILAGAFDDFLRRIPIARFGGPYSQVTWGSFTRGILAELGQPATASVLAGCALLSFKGPPLLRLPARTWLLALVGVLFYKPISPVAHPYLDEPLILARSISIAPLCAWVLSTAGMAASFRLAAIVALVLGNLPHRPIHCPAQRSLDVVAGRFWDTERSGPPPGCTRYFGTHAHVHYRWDDYQRLLTYLRHALPPQTRVANVLRSHPYPTLNGAAGRLSPFPAAGGLLHLAAVDPGLEARFVAALEQTADSVVVWVPTARNFDRRMAFPSLIATIERLYRPRARFGNLEVWQREGATQATPERTAH